MASNGIIGLALTVFLVLLSGVNGDDMKDVAEGDNVVLECRFAPHLISRGRETLFWFRTNAMDKDNVAIGETPLDTNYAIDYRPAEGRYDLKIQNATYDRDNGRFECRIKASGSGQELHSKIVQLTVLLLPGEPRVTPSEPTATEGRSLDLSCSSSGGSPDPLITWYRNGMNYPLDSIVKSGGSRRNPTSAILSVTPVRDDDGTEYRCVVWNRALGEGVKLETTVTLNVNYFPRVKVGPENPLRVEKGSLAKLHCSVDSKPAVSSVRWTRNGKFSETTFTYTIPRTTLSDAGTYQCSAENGLGQSGESDLTLDVLYAPIVAVSSNKEYAEGDSVWIKCNVTSNPRPSSVEWLRKDDPNFRQLGDVLRIERVTAANVGTYICKATNLLNPSGDVNPYERTGNASITLQIKHAPGKTVIEPTHPAVVEGSGVTLSCKADPPGWPLPQFRWWREGSESTIGVGPNLNIGTAKVTTEGKYYCQPNNEIGTGTVASVHLRVHQAPRITTGLQSQIIRRTGEAGFSVTCAAQGIPKPSVTWVKDGIPLENNPNFHNLYKIDTKELVESVRATTVHSTLHFSGNTRETISADDRGYYSCVFENEVKKDDSHMYLRVHHKPIFQHKNEIERVAYDVQDTAAIPCKVQAFPKPEFDWSFNSIALRMDVKNYEMNLTILPNDVYISTLYVKGIRGIEDYGEYVCRAANPMGNSTAVILLQERGRPSAPSRIEAVATDISSVLLKYEPGFNGGYDNTKYLLSYYSERNVNKVEFDCQNFNPCNVTGLEQKTVYVFKVKAHNAKGSSEYSPSTTVVTKVDLATIPDPVDVKFEPKSRTFLFNFVGPVPIRAKLELQDGEGSWRKYRMLSVETDKFRTLIDEDKPVENVRVALCVDNEESCGRTVSAMLVNDIPAVAPIEGRVHYVIAGVVSGIVVLLCLCLILIFCCCRKKDKVVKKDYETGRGHQTQVVPPPYYTNGMENKGLERSMDIIDDTMKNNYNGQNGYITYNGHVPNGNGNIPYIDQNSYSNSNNGGSVDSQDSLWKVSQVPHEQLTQQQLQAQHIQQQHAHPPPHLRGNYEQYPPPDESYLPYEARTNNYVTDPYGPIPKPKRRLDLNGEHEHSPYHELSGLPDPYMDPSQDEHQGSVRAHNMTMTFEESLESGYSTPNSRNRRIIREIIV